MSAELFDGCPLDGYRVVDLSSGIAGAYCTKLLRDAGADVVKVETDVGDPLRRWFGPDSPERVREDGALFRYLAAGKRSVLADPTNPSDVQLVANLVALSDAVVWSKDSALTATPELAPEYLRRKHPHAAVVAITPFGLTGPWVDQPSTEATRQAWSGGLGQRGAPTGPPILAGASLGDWMAGTIAAAGLLASRQRSLTTRDGELIDVSILEALAYTTTMYPVTYYDVVGEPRYPVRVANLPDIHPTKDGFVGFMVVTGQQWLDFAAMVEHPEWIADESLLLLKVRWGRRPEFMAAINAWTEQRTLDEVVELASLFRIPVAPVSDGSSVVEHVGKELFEWNEHNSFLQPQPPYTLGATAKLREPGPSPALGEHGAEVRLAVAAMLSRNEKPGMSGDEESRHTGATLPFEGLRVVDFTAYWAGPIVGIFMAMLGAEVIHVESTSRVDALRMNTAKTLDEDEWWEWSALWSGSNTNKRDLTLDMSSEEGRRLARSLVAQSDVVIENYSPRVMENWGLGYEQLKLVKDDIIMVRMPAFGLSGPLRDRVGYAQTLEHVSGLSFVTGLESEAPVTLNGVCDPLAGTHATIGLMLALEHRRRTGEGMLVEAPMLRGSLNAAAEQVVHHSAYGTLLQRRGNRSWIGAPQGVYLTADVDEDGTRDRWVVISIEDDLHWKALVAAVGSPDWALDERLSTIEGRRAAHDELDEQMATWCSVRGSQQIIDGLWPAGVPVAVVVLPHEQPQVAQLDARGFFETVSHPVTGLSRHAAYPVKFSNGPERFHRSHAPLLGQDNAYVLGQILGLDGAEIARLSEDGVIGNAPSKSKAW